MDKHTHTHTHEVNSLDEIIAKVKEYASKEGNWKLKSSSTAVIENNGKSKHGTVLENDKGEDIFIYTGNFSPNEDTIRLIEEAEKLLPYTSKSSAKKPKEPEKPKESLIDDPWLDKEQEGKSYIYHGCLDLAGAKQLIRKYYQKYQTQIKNTPDFSNWLEVSEVPAKNFGESVFHISLGKKRQTPRKRHVFDFVETSLYRDIEAILSVRKENLKEKSSDYRETALKIETELEKYWNDLINDRQVKTAEKSKEISPKTENNKNNEKNVNRLTIALIIVALTILISGIIYFYLRKKKLINKTKP